MMAEGGIGFLIATWIKFFVLFTPFFALSMFLSETRGYETRRRRGVVLHTSIAVLLICLFIFFFGRHLFAVFGITLDAFRVGAGILLFLSAVKLVLSRAEAVQPDPESDIAVVPLAIPVIVGPATIGALLVLGGEIQRMETRLLGCVALVLAVVCMGCLLWLGSALERTIGSRGIEILSRITGLILAALAAQVVMTGVKHFYQIGMNGALR